MPEDMTTRWENVRGRAEFLKRGDRMNCDDIKGKSLTEAERFAYAICEELDRMEIRLEKK